MKPNVTSPKEILPLVIFCLGLSCGNRITPKMYNANPKKVKHHKAKNVSLFIKPHCSTKSAFERNLIANAISKNPNTTFTVFNQPPDFGRDFNQLGNAANNANGKPSASPNPAIAKVNFKDTTAVSKPKIEI